MRQFIDIINEAAFQRKEMAGSADPYYNGKYLKPFLAKVVDGDSHPVAPGKQAQYGQAIQVDPNMIPALQATLTGGAVPTTVGVILNGQVVQANWNIFDKASYSGRAQQDPTDVGDIPVPGEGPVPAGKAYNAGHLAELIQGLAVSAKFFNTGKPITLEQVMAMTGYVDVDQHVNDKGKITSNLKFTITRMIEYPKGKSDTFTFNGVVPGKSAKAFINMIGSQIIASDIQALMASAVLYVNESPTVEAACKRVAEDPDNNEIIVTSDGTSDSGGTKADIVMDIDGTRTTLLSMKTYGSDTLGQVSGNEYDNVHRWFDVSFGIDISKYKNLLDPDLGKTQVVHNILNKLYDEVVYPQVQVMFEDQSPGVEAKIVKHITKAAHIFARGERLEDVEIVKLDDKIPEGSYKVLRFSDNLVELMKHLDLDTRYVNTGGQGRTIQIMVKMADESGKPVKLCQFRSQVMGGYLRNYFESGPMLEEMTLVGQGSGKSQDMRPKREPNTAPLGRERRA